MTIVAITGNFRHPDEKRAAPSAESWAARFMIDEWEYPAIGVAHL